MAAHESVNPQQLKMFMTPREIHSQYQPLDADRLDAERSGSWTQRSATTGGRPNYALQAPYAGTNRRGFTVETDSDLWQRKGEEAQLSPRDYYEAREGQTFQTPQFDIEGVMGRSSYPTAPSTESTSAWGEHEYRENSYLERKEGEHQQAWDEHMGGQSVWEGVQQEGVKSPIHLGQQFGSEGKPQIVGGHHRIAAATATRPDDLIPVIHHEDIKQAKSDSSSGYKYT